MVGRWWQNISESTSRKKVEERSKSAHDNQNASTLNQDRTKQEELKNTAQQVGEDRSKQIDVGGTADQTFLLSKLPPVLTIHVVRLMRTGHVEFEENLDLQEYLEPRSEYKDDARYRLVGVIENLGRSVNEVQFVAYVRGRKIVNEQEPSSGSFTWFRASDTSIREISLDKVLKFEAFLLSMRR